MSKRFRQPPKSAAVVLCTIPLASVYEWTQTHTEEHTHSLPVLTEVYEHLAIALPHVLWHGEDAGNVVVQERVLLLWKENIKSVNTNPCLFIRTNIFELEVTGIYTGRGYMLTSFSYLETE